MPYRYKRRAPDRFTATHPSGRNRRLQLYRRQAKANFLADKRTQQAVVMSLIIVGEAATNIMDRYPEFSAEQATIPWRSMRGMRNRIAHGYFDIDLEVDGQTVKTALLELLSKLPSVQSLASAYDPSRH